MNNSENSKKMPFYSKIIMLNLILSVPLAVFNGIILFKYTDVSNGLVNNELAGNIFFILLITLLAASVCVYFPISKSDKAPEFLQKQTALNKILNVVCSALLLAVLVLDIFTMMTNKGAFSYLLAVKDLLCALSLIYFLWSAFKTEKKAQAPLSKIAVLIPALLVAVQVIMIFIDIKTQINAPQRSYTLLMLVIMMMSFVSESEMNVPLTKEEIQGNIKQKKLAKYVVYSCLALVLAIIVAVPQIVYGIFVTHDMGDIIYTLSNLALALINGKCAIFFCVTQKALDMPGKILYNIERS